ncbi:MAG TPA: two-component regulator propeller domain-containing protein, partial [Sphingobacteriaceae bacterium]
MNCLKFLPNGELWIGTDRGVSVFDGKKFFSPPGFAGIEVSSIAFGPKQDIWITSTLTGIYRLTENEVHHLAKQDTTVWEAQVDREGRIWFASQLHGVFYFEEKKFVQLGTPTEPTSRSIRTITEDRDGTIWIGTFSRGVWRYNGSAVSSYGSEHGLSSDVRGITQDKEGNLWMALHYGGIVRFDGKNFSYFSRAQGLPGNDFFSVFEDSMGNMWFGGIGGDGIIKYDGKLFTTYRAEQGLSNETVTAILEDRDGTMWFGTQDGIQKFEDGLFTKINWPSKLDTRYIRSIIQARDGKLWVGAHGGGVASYDGKVFRSYSTTDGLATNDINCIHEEKQGNIWFAGTNGGLTRFDGKGFLTIAVSHPVPNEAVNAIVEDKDGKLWLGTNNGIRSLEFITAGKRVTGAGLFSGSNEDIEQSVQFKWETFDGSSGFPIRAVNPNVMIYLEKTLPALTNSQGMIWMGCGDGSIIRFDSREVKRAVEPPQIQLKNVQLDETQIAWYSLQKNTSVDSAVLLQQQMIYGTTSTLALNEDSTRQHYRGIRLDGVERFSNVPRNLVLPYHFTRITFQFNAVELSRNSTVQYQYRLEGQHPHWSAATSSNVASFSNLIAGDYQFQARARTRDSTWGPPVTFEFSVLPPWWQTRSMYIFYGVAFVLIIAGFMRWRERRLHQANQRLEQLVGERTRELEDQLIEAERQRRLVEV